MKKTIILAFAALALFTTSCDRLTQGVVRDIDMPPHTPRLVASLFADSRDSTIRATVGKSQGLYEPGEPKSLSGANIRLMQDGQLLHAWNTTNPIDSAYELHLGDRLGTHTGSIMLVVEHPDFDSAYSVQRFPSAPVVKNIQIDYDAVENWGFTQDRMTLTLEDLPGENQHYVITADVHSTDLAQDTSIYTECFLVSSAPGVTRAGEALIASEAGIDQDLTFSFTTGVGDSSYFIGGQYLEREYRVRVRAVSDDYYYFMVSYNAYEAARANPFAEPAIIHDNLENGIGCFGLSTSTIARK